MQIIISLLVSGLSVFIADYLLSGVSVNGFVQAVLVAIVLGVVNTFVKPILLLLTLPLNVVTFGLFTFVVNALMVMLVSRLIPDFYVANFWWALAFSLVLSLVSSFMNTLSRD